MECINKYTPPYNILEDIEYLEYNLNKLINNSKIERNIEIEGQRIIIENLEKKIRILETNLLNMEGINDISINIFEYEIEYIPIINCNDLKDEISANKENNCLKEIYLDERILEERLINNIVNNIKEQIKLIINSNEMYVNNTINIETNEVFEENINESKMVYGNIKTNNIIS